MRTALIILTIIGLFLQACRQRKKEVMGNERLATMEFARYLSFRESNSGIVVNSGGQSVKFSNEELPLKSCIAIPTSVVAYLDALDLTDRLIAVDQPDYIYNVKIHDKIKNGRLKVIGDGSRLMVEEILTLQPDVVFSTSNPNWALDHEFLQQAGIKVVFIDEYLETTYKAKLEYLKLVGALFGRTTSAKDHIQMVEKNIADLSKSYKDFSPKSVLNPKILMGRMYGDVWYMPGGQSATVELLRLNSESKLNYPWADSQERGALHLGFEEVFEQAHDADLWLNAGDFKSLEELKDSYEKYEWFQPFRTGQVYSITARKSDTGANDYFETGIIRPDLILSDLKIILNQFLSADTSVENPHGLTFYQKLE